MEVEIVNFATSQATIEHLRAIFSRFGSLEVMVTNKSATFSFQLRLTPNATTGVVPAELLLLRRPRSYLDSVVPHLKSRVHHQQQKQKAQHDQHLKPCYFTQGDLVFIRHFHRGTAKPTWLPGTVIQRMVDQITK